MEIITQEFLHFRFDYKDGFLYWKNSRVDRNGKLAGCISNSKTDHPRRVITIGKTLYLSARLIFLYHKGYLPEVVDHEDRNTLNDKIDNLRDSTNGKNMANRSSSKNYTSKYLGVSSSRQKYKKADGSVALCPIRWSSSICFNGKSINLGSFKKETDAALAYNRAAVKYHGEFANLNIIKND